MVVDWPFHVLSTCLPTPPGRLLSTSPAWAVVFFEQQRTGRIPIFINTRMTSDLSLHLLSGSLLLPCGEATSVRWHTFTWASSSRAVRFQSAIDRFVQYKDTKQFQLRYLSSDLLSWSFVKFQWSNWIGTWFSLDSIRRVLCVGTDFPTLIGIPLRKILSRRLG